jgi:hypothetical protein
MSMSVIVVIVIALAVGLEKSSLGAIVVCGCHVVRA